MLKTARTVRLLKSISIGAEPSDILSDIGINRCWVGRRKALSIQTCNTPCLQWLSWTCPPNYEYWDLRREADLNADFNASVAIGCLGRRSDLMKPHAMELLGQAITSLLVRAGTTNKTSFERFLNYVTRKKYYTSMKGTTPKDR